MYYDSVADELDVIPPIRSVFTNYLIFWRRICTITDYENRIRSSPVNVIGDDHNRSHLLLNILSQSYGLEDHHIHHDLY